MSINTLVVLIVLFFSAQTFAEGDNCINTIWCTGKVEEVYPHKNAIYVRIGEDMSKLNCALHEGKYARLDNDNPNKSEIYGTLLAAHISQSTTIKMRIVEGKSDDCEILYITSKY